MSGLRLVLLDSIRPWGGGEKWVLETARTLAGRGHAVHVAAARGSELAERARAAGLSVHELGGVLGLTGAYVLLVVLMPATLFWGAPLDAGVYAANVLGLALFTLMHVSLGLMCSALTRQPVAAALAALVVSLALWLLDWAVRLDPAASHIGAHATLGRLRGFSLGLVSSADIAWFVLASLLFLALTALLVDADRSLT